MQKHFDQAIVRISQKMKDERKASDRAKVHVGEGIVAVQKDSKRRTKKAGPPTDAPEEGTHAGILPSRMTVAERGRASLKTGGRAFAELPAPLDGSPRADPVRRRKRKKSRPADASMVSLSGSDESDESND